MARWQATDGWRQVQASASQAMLTHHPWCWESPGLAGRPGPASLLWYKWLWRAALSSQLKENVTSAVQKRLKEQSRPDTDVTRTRRGQPSLPLLAMSLHRTANYWFQRIRDVQLKRGPAGNPTATKWGVILTELQAVRYKHTIQQHHRS